MSKHKVIVNVYGGVVQDVFADPNIEVVVVDWDTEGLDERSLRRAVGSAGNALEASCYKAAVEDLNAIVGSDCGAMVAALEANTPLAH